jgi:hypothetical protein
MKNWYYIVVNNLIPDDAKTVWNIVKDNITDDNDDIRSQRKCTDFFYHVNLGQHNIKWNVLQQHYKSITPEIPLLEFYIAEPYYHMASPHTDRVRSVAINIPIQVDLENSNAFFGKSTNLEDYQHIKQQNKSYTFKITNAEGNVIEDRNENYKGVYHQEYYDNVKLTHPVLFNPAMPHGGWNKSNSKRVILSLSWFDINFEDFVTQCNDLGYLK